MFKRLETSAAPAISITFDGVELRAVEGEPLAAALLAAGISTTRESPVTGHPRAPYCMMGACFDCLVQIDGRTVQACMVPARDGMTIERPTGILGSHAGSADQPGGDGAGEDGASGDGAGENGAGENGE